MASGLHTLHATLSTALVERKACAIVAPGKLGIEVGEDEINRLFRKYAMALVYSVVHNHLAEDGNVSNCGEKTRMT